MQTVGSAWSQFQCGCVKLRWRSCFDTEISTICHRFVAQSVLDGEVTERTLAKSNQNIPQPARPLRIALVTETYPPEINGVASTVAQLVAGLLLEGHFVEVTRPRQPKVDGVSKNGPSPRTGGMGDGGRSLGGQPPRFSERLTSGIPIPRYPELKLGLPAAGRLERDWKAQPPDIVHIATEGPLGWSALRVARRLGLPVVSEFRTNFHAYSAHYGIGPLRHWVLGYLRRFHNRCAFTMVPTTGLAAELEASGFERLKVVARGVDASRFHPSRRSQELRSSWGAGPSTLVMVAVGRIAPEKNLDLLVSAYRKIRTVQPDARLVVVGDGPARAWLQREAPDAVFAGRRSGEDLAAHYASADLLLFPSLTETFGNVTLEAMASGVAVLAFDYGAAGQSVVSGVHGWTVPYGDRSAFERTAECAAADMFHLRRLGAQGRPVAETMAWTEIVREVQGIYLSTLQSARSRGLQT